MTVDGMGVATLPAAMVARDLAAGDLVRLHYGWNPQPLHFYARFDAERSARLTAQAAGIAAEVAQAYTAAFKGAAGDLTG